MPRKKKTFAGDTPPDDLGEDAEFEEELPSQFLIPAAPQDGMDLIDENHPEFQALLAKYKADYDVESLNQSNDRRMLYDLITNQILVRRVQKRYDQMLGMHVEPKDLKPLSDMLKDLQATIINMMNSLRIARSTRKNDQQETVLAYIQRLKKEAPAYLEKRLINVRCPSCKILVGIHFEVDKTTPFSYTVICHQCKHPLSFHQGEIAD